jgi:hypothetical protein
MAKTYPGLLFDWGRAMIPETPRGRPGTLSEALRLQRGLGEETDRARIRDDPFFPKMPELRLG